MQIKWWIACLCCVCLSGHLQAQTENPHFPDSVYVEGGRFHVQGIAVDKERKHMYFSFTTRLLKTDLQGRVLGSVEGINGHLGCLALNPGDGRLYASLECKDDAIGRSIARKTGVDVAKNNAESLFYVAVFDPERITRMGMDARQDSVMYSVFLPEVAADYSATVRNRGKRQRHRYACSGIDGLAFAPAVGNGRHDGTEWLLYVAYGIYGDTLRTDNDHQVLLCYDTRRWARYAVPADWDNLQRRGPRKPLCKYFVYTGNTNYGVQNLAYDPATGYLLMAVYKGRKAMFPNYSLFAVDCRKPSRKAVLRGVQPAEKGRLLSLADAGMADAATGIRGWHFAWGSTGLCPLGNGLFYVSHNARKADGTETCTARLYRWTGAADCPLEPVGQARE